jgi:hypothetical protein
LDYLDRFFPEGMERVRQYFPELESAEVAQAARTWFDSVAQPRLKNTVARGRLGPLVQRVLDQNIRTATDRSEQEASEHDVQAAPDENQPPSL